MAQIERADVLNHVAKLLAKRSEGFVRAEIMDQGRAIHGVSTEDNDITREVHNIKHFTAQAVVTMGSATQTKGKKFISILKTQYIVYKGNKRGCFTYIASDTEHFGELERSCES